jgi:hypothetical protein
MWFLFSYSAAIHHLTISGIYTTNALIISAKQIFFTANQLIANKTFKRIAD